MKKKSAKNDGAGYQPTRLPDASDVERRKCGTAEMWNDD